MFDMKTLIYLLLIIAFCVFALQGAYYCVLFLVFTELEYLILNLVFWFGALIMLALFEHRETCI